MLGQPSVRSVSAESMAMMHGARDRDSASTATTIDMPLQQDDFPPRELARLLSVEQYEVARPVDTTARGLSAPRTIS